MNAREADHPSLEFLRARSGKIDKTIGSAQRRFDNLAPGVLNPGTPARAVIFGRRRERIGGLLERLRSERVSVSSEIQNFKTQDELVVFAEDFLIRRAAQEREVRELERLVSEGHVEEHFLKASKMELGELNKQPDSDVQIKRGLELLEERQREEELARTRVGLKLDVARNSAVVTYPDRSRRELTAMGPVEFVLLRQLASHPRAIIAEEKIAKELKGLDGNGYPPDVLMEILALRKKLERTPADPVILREVEGSYYLNAKVSFVKGGKRFDNNTPIIESRLEAINLLSPDATDAGEILKTLGQMTNGKPFSSNQASFSLVRNISRLSSRYTQGTVTDRECAIWEAAEAKFRTSEDESTVNIRKIMTGYVIGLFRSYSEGVKVLV